MAVAVTDYRRQFDSDTAKFVRCNDELVIRQSVVFYEDELPLWREE